MVDLWNRKKGTERSEYDDLGREWLSEQVDQLTDTVTFVSPVEFNEMHRYISPTASPTYPGPMSFDVNPYMREPLNCCAVESPVREVTMKKGVQITYTCGLLESIIFYYMVHQNTLSMMFVTADKDMAIARVEGNVIPMINDSGFARIIQSSDEESNKKTGKTSKRISWMGGGFLLPEGANNANKMRMNTISVMLKDEVDGWPRTVGRDGDPFKLTDARLKGLWDRRKIFRGSTPVDYPSPIEDSYQLGDQRKYFVPCKHCAGMQFLVWNKQNREVKEGSDQPKEYGIIWKLEENGTLDLNSVRYVCKFCGGEHLEADKYKMFAKGEWRPTAVPSQPNIRSYHLPALYSPVGMAPWSALVADWLEVWDVEHNRIKDIGKYQVFQNNNLAEPWRVFGGNVELEAVSMHRRVRVYNYGEIPNKYAIEHSGSRVLFLICTVDVHDAFLAVTVWGFTKGARAYLIDYHQMDAPEGQVCTDPNCIVWSELRSVVTDSKYTSDDGIDYGIFCTLIDAAYSGDTVATFCREFVGAWVFPIHGVETVSKRSRKHEFEEWKTKSGVMGWLINVDYYKDRLAHALRAQWDSQMGIPQNLYHFNAPSDVTTEQLKELTVESKKKKTDPKTGTESHYWHRPQGSRNELWDLLVYAHAALEMIAFKICMEIYREENVDWPKFWAWAESRIRPV